MISARHTTNRQSFKKVTCPFNNVNIWIYLFFHLPSISWLLLETKQRSRFCFSLFYSCVILLLHFIHYYLVRIKASEII